MSLRIIPSEQRDADPLQHRIAMAMQTFRAWAAEIQSIVYENPNALDILGRDYGDEVCAGEIVIRTIRNAMECRDIASIEVGQ